MTFEYNPDTEKIVDNPKYAKITEFDRILIAAAGGKYDDVAKFKKDLQKSLHGIKYQQ